MMQFDNKTHKKSFLSLLLVVPLDFRVQVYVYVLMYVHNSKIELKKNYVSDCEIQSNVTFFICK